MRTRHLQRVLLAAAITAVAAAVLAAATPAAERNAYVQHNLVSDGFLPADHTDANLVNAWGLTSLPGSPWWVSDNGTDVSTLYGADGTPRSLVVSVPNAPTGAVSNTGSSFVVGSGPALFLFATEEGKLLGWNMSVGTTAQVVADKSGEGAVFKGLAIAGDRLYATDFHNAKVDVFDGSFSDVNTPGAFVDPRIPRGFAPFGIQTIGGDIFVTYAKQDADAHDDVAGQALGFVDEFDANGALIARVAQRGQLNSPWGLAMAPANFGRFSDDLLVGNFGNGQITAFARQPNGRFEARGQLRSASGGILTIDGLWALQFGKGALANNGPTDSLFFTAGPDDESHGLFGTIRAAG
jgi:uncharacterized protein (TIGR03118 family)